MAERFAPVCVVCGTTLEGPLGVLFHLFGIRRSGRNPNICNRCDAHMQEGRIIEMSVLFADLTSFTEMTHRLGAERSYQVVDSFFKMVNGILVKHDAFIDKYIGDAVMAIFNAPIRNAEHARSAAMAAMDIQEGLKDLRVELGLDLRAQVGVASGYARVGRVGSEDRKDYTAIGDVVNLASRLEGQAAPGEVLVDGAVYTHVTEDYPGVAPEILTIRGFPDPITAYRIRAEQQAQHSMQKSISDPETRRQVVGLGAVLFAILGAPCAITTIIGPLSILLGLGAAFSSLGPVLGTLDSVPVRIPLQVIAVLGALINLSVISYGLRRQANSGLPMTRQEQRKLWLVGGLAIFSLLAVGYEMYAHVFIEHMALF